MNIRELYSDLYAQELTMVKEAGIAPWLAGAGLLGAGVGMPLMYSAGKRRGVEEGSKGRAAIFGAGALSGALAAPALMRLKNSLGLGLVNGVNSVDFTSF